MIEATTRPALRRAAEEAHRQRSLAAWQIIAALRALLARLFGGHKKGTARLDGPSDTLRCAA